MSRVCIEWAKAERYEHRDESTGAWLTVRGSGDEWMWSINGLGDGNAAGLAKSVGSAQAAVLRALAEYKDKVRT